MMLRRIWLKFSGPEQPETLAEKFPGDKLFPDFGPQWGSLKRYLAERGTIIPGRPHPFPGSTRPPEAPAQIGKSAAIPFPILLLHQNHRSPGNPEIDVAVERDSEVFPDPYRDRNLSFTRHFHNITITLITWGIKNGEIPPRRARPAGGKVQRLTRGLPPSPIPTARGFSLGDADS